MSDIPANDPLDPALSPTVHYDEAAIKRARELLNNMPESVGPYRILERIGGGGMGEVYRAEQRSPIRRQVALKFIKLGMDSKAVLARFEAERQALALMDHPHIAKVFDAGTDDTGRPYFVMEYVKGKPITDYADQNHLTIRERLELFEQVCQAIQHAHHKGVIHRDLKPGNVLVSTQDDKPYAKVIDFGIAKAISQKLTDATLFTQHDQFVGTPQYMSPEQAEGSVDIDTRTDVYSLGVLLYELLTGSTPFSTKDLRIAAFEQLKKLIIEVDPPKPSTRLTLNQPTLSTLAASRRTEPKRLGTLVQGELDWIVMKSLEKDRKRRYETPTSLANDIQAHLQGEPVQAAPPSTAYRIQKFVKKHRGPVIAVAMVMAVLLLGVAGTTWGLIRARIAEHAASESEKNAIHERDAKEEQRKLAEAATHAESEQRTKAERQLVSGILRPIGFNKEKLDPSELKSLADWSALGNSRLQLLALEVAFEDPATALRVARRSERVIQSCVGLSPQRRAQAIQLVSAKQRDLESDPRIRIAACWLALELGSADLPALDESPRFLGQGSTIWCEFVEFIHSAVSRTDTQQRTTITQRLANGILANSSRETIPYWLKHPLAGDAVSILSERLPVPEKILLFERMLSLFENPNVGADSSSYEPAAKIVISIAPHLADIQRSKAWDLAQNFVLKSEHVYGERAATQILLALVSLLAPREVKSRWNELSQLVNQSISNSSLRGQGDLLSVLTALASRLEDNEFVRVLGEVDSISKDVTSTETSRVFARLIWFTLRPRFEINQTRRSADRLAVQITQENDPTLVSAAVKELQGLAKNLESPVASQIGDRLIPELDSLENEPRLQKVINVLSMIAPRLPPTERKVLWNKLIVILNSESANTETRHAVGYALSSLGATMEPAEVPEAWGQLIEVVTEPKEYFAAFAAGDGLASLTPHLERQNLAAEYDALCNVIVKPKDYSSALAACVPLSAIAARLDQPQARRVADLLLPLCTEPLDGFPRMPFDGFAKAVSILNSPEKQHRCIQLATAILDLETLTPRKSYEGAHGDTQTPCECFQRLDFSPRELAALLSHPSCTGFYRHVLLQRFEELLFHDGKPVFLTKPESETEARPSPQPQPEPPPRRFHNLHDAAAWIQQNWPDFDLETNHPVTWHGEQK